MEYIGKKGRLDYRIDIALDVKQYYFSLSKNDWKSFENQEFTRKMLLTDLMKEMLRNLLGSAYFGKVGAEVCCKGNGSI